MEGSSSVPTRSSAKAAPALVWLIIGLFFIWGGTTSVGGAIIPVITGGLADASTIATALIVPVVCYLIISGFGLFARKPVAA